MSSIDQRIVQMKFDNAAFQQAAAATLKTLESLNKGVQLAGATKGLHDFGAAANAQRTSLGHVEGAIQSIADRFKALSVIGITALASIAHKAVETGTQLVRSLTIEPLRAGFREYETNLNSIQTILANTSKAGTTLKDVNAALAELNEYSDQTIYNFSEMARNIGTFTAAGVKLDVATSAIKGIANLAALSGSNAQQASTAMYQLSQAISAGRVTLEDWNSVVNAGMGGRVFQDALMETARIHGVAIDQMVKDSGSFRLTLQEGWLTGEILTETLMKFTGDLTAAQLKSMGYNEKQIAEILKMAAIAKAAATEVKTASQLISTLQEAAGSGWARTWELIFGDFDEAKELWTGVNNVLGEFIKGSAEARNQVLSDWKELGGRTVMIEAVSNAFQALLSVARPIKDAFREIFPAVTGKQLYDITVAIRDFTAGLKIGGETAENLRRTFAGVFAIFSIGWDIIKEGIGLFARLLGVTFEGSGGILEFTANIGDFIVGLREALKEGKGLEKFFGTLGDILEGPIRILKSFATFLGSLFDDFDGTTAAKGVAAFVANLVSVEGFGNKIGTVWEKTLSVLDTVFEKFRSMAGKVTEFFKGFGIDISKILQGINLQNIMGAIATGGFAALLLSLRGAVNNVSGIFESLTGSLGAMQNTLRAATLVQIAVAIGLLTLSVSELSKIDPVDLAKSAAALGIMFTELLAAMLIFEKLSGFTGFAKMPFIGASMILLAAAVKILASAAKDLAELSWDELHRGLTGLTVILGSLIITMHLMPNPAGMISSSVALVILAGAIKILVTAVEDLAELSWEELAKGLVGVAVLLGALGLFSTFSKVNAGGLLSGAGIILLAVGIKILADAVKDMAEMSWQEIARGMTVMAGALLAIGVALALIPPSSILSAAGILIVAASLGMIGDAIKGMAEMSWSEIGRGMTVLAGALTAIGLALTLIPPTAPLTAAGIFIVAQTLSTITDALKDMATMSWEEIAKGLITLSASLLIIAVGVNAMSGALTGAAAMLIVAASLAILAPVLLTFSQMSWEEMAKGLLMLAGVFAVLGVAGLLLAPLVPILIGLGIAITLIGVGILAAGAGVFLFAAGLTAMSVAGAAATVALVAMIGALAGMIPEVMKQLGLGIVAFAEVIATAGPAMYAAMVAVLMALLEAIDTTTPKLIETLFKMLTLLLETILKYMPRLVDAGMKIVIAFLDGVARNIGKVVDKATDVAVAFLDGMAKNLPRIIQSGVNFIISFVNGVAQAIRDRSSEMGEAGANLATAIVEGMIRGLASGAGKIASKAREIAANALSAAKSALGISSPSKEFTKVGEFAGQGLVNGLDNMSKGVNAASEEMGEGAIKTLRNTLAGLAVVINEDIDMSPVITPVLDLSRVKRTAGQITTMLPSSSLSVASNYSSAKQALIDAQNNRNTQQETTTEVPGSTNLSYTQINNSPKALSAAEIYRQTKNQLSTVKGAL